MTDRDDETGARGFNVPNFRRRPKKKRHRSVDAAIRKGRIRPGPNGEMIGRSTYSVMDMDLRKEAWRKFLDGCTWGEISRHIGQPVPVVRGWVKEIVNEHVATPEEVAYYRSLQLARLEHDMQITRAMRKTYKDTELALKATDRIMKIHDREANLLGLDAPQRSTHEVNTPEKMDARLLKILEAAKRRNQEIEAELNGDPEP